MRTHGEKPCEDGGQDRGRGDASTSQGALKSPGSPQKLEEARQVLPYRFQREHSPADTLILALAPRALGERTSAVLGRARKLLYGSTGQLRRVGNSFTRATRSSLVLMRDV